MAVAASGGGGGDCHDYGARLHFWDEQWKLNKTAGKGSLRCLTEIYLEVERMGR